MYMTGERQFTYKYLYFKVVTTTGLLRTHTQNPVDLYRNGGKAGFRGMGFMTI